MYYLVHLAVPSLVVLAVVLVAPPPEPTLSGLQKALENFALSYMMFSAPHWIWAAVTAYFDMSKGGSIGGFVGLHALLGGVTLLVFASTSSEAANGWILYFIGAPIAILVGVTVGRFVSIRQTTKPSGVSE